MSRTPLFAMTSDWHLQPGAWKRANTPQGDSFYALRQIRQHCVEHQLDLLAAGDLFDDLKPETSVLERAFRECDNLHRASRRLVFTQGQHEKAFPAYLSLHPSPMHNSRKVTHVRGISVYGMDHVPADQLEAEIEKVPSGVDVLMCHQVWGDFMGIGAEGHLSQLSKAGGPRIVLTGDYHDHQVLEVGGLVVYSPGSTCLQSIDEPREKSFFVFYDDFSVESVQLKVRRVVDLTITNEAELEDCLKHMGGYLAPGDGLPPDMQKNIIYVQCANINQAYKRITKAIGDKAFLFWKSLIGQTGDVYYDEQEAARVVPQGLEGCLHLVTPEGGPVYNSVLRLIRAGDKKVELAAMAAEFGR